jgi:hypothetical protein
MAGKSENIATINLQDFVTEALVQIAHGVSEAQKRVHESGAMINPYDSVVDSSGRVQWAESGFGSERQYGEKVEFDIAVTAADKGELKGGIGVVSGVFNLGVKAGQTGESSSVSRIRFSVPMFLPQQMIEIPKEK